MEFPNLHHPTSRALAAAVDRPLGAAINMCLRTHDPEPLRSIAAELRKAEHARVKAAAAAEAQSQSKNAAADQRCADVAPVPSHEQVGAPPPLSP